MLPSNQHPAAHKWDQRYQSAEQPGSPISVLEEHNYLLSSQGQALDLACGLGANALFLARQGYHCEAMDISAVALDKLQHWAKTEQLAVTTHQVDLETVTLATASFDVVTVGYYLDRALFPAIIDALKPGGLLFYQTFSQTYTDDHQGPQNPAFRLADNELLALAGDLNVRFYCDLLLTGDVDRGLRNEVQLVAQKC